MKETDDDATLLINYKVVNEAIPYVYKIIINWGTDKKPEETFKEYLTRKDMLVPTDKWILKNSDRLNSVNCDEFDVTFLFSLINQICKGICFPGSKEYETLVLNENSVEFLLKKTKQFRNEIIHDKEKITNSNIHGEVQNSLTDLLEAVSRLYFISNEELHKRLGLLNGLFDEIRDTKLQSSNKVKYITEILVRFGREEKKKVWEANCSNIRLPFSNTIFNRLAIFHDIKLLFIRVLVGSYMRDTTAFTSSSLFKTTDLNLKIIQGIPGSGKTTLTKTIMEKWLNVGEENWNFDDLNKFDLVLLYECRTTVTKSFAELVKSNYPETLSGICEEDIHEALKSLKILVMIDGYDEKKVNSEKLLLEIIDNSYQSANIVVIVTSRPLAGSELQSILRSKNYNYDSITIDGLRDLNEQLKFLEKYQSSMRIGNKKQNNNTMLEAFRNLPLEMSQIFVSPILLAMFCYICEEDLKSVGSWTTENQVYESLYQLIRTKMQQRILDHSRLCSSEVRSYVNVLAREIGRLGLKLINEKCYFLTGETYISFCECCSSAISSSLDYNDIFSSVLSPESSAIAGGANTYHFFHSSVQEYFAAKYICGQLEQTELPKKHQTKIGKIIAAVIGDTPSRASLVRYANVIKFVALTVINDKNFELLPDLCSFISEMGAGFSYCIDIIVASCNNLNFTKQISAVVQEDIIIWEFYTSTGVKMEKSRKGWRVSSGSQMIATTNLLEFRKPTFLSVYMTSNSKFSLDQMVHLMRSITKTHFSGFLEVFHNTSRNNFIPIDEVPMALKNSRVRLKVFVGCLKSAEAIRVVSSKTKISVVVLSILDPMRHNLECFKNRFTSLVVWVNYMKLPDVVDTYNPLPQGIPFLSINTVHIKNIPADGTENTKKIIKCLTPVHYRLKQLNLMRCELSDESIRNLMSHLQETKLRTYSYGYSRFFIPGSDTSGNCKICHLEHADPTNRCLSLHITNNNPSRFEPFIDRMYRYMESKIKI